MERNRGICHLFQRGSCRFGARCRYSHDTSLASTSRATVEDSMSSELEKWKKQATHPRPLGGFGLGKFFEEALRLVNLDNASRQDVIRTLATDRGLTKVLELVDQDFGRLSAQFLRHTFTAQIIPLFQALSEPHVMSSPLLEQHLGAICQLLYGVGGSRGERLFSTVVQVLTALMKNPDIKFFTAIEASLAILSKIFEFNNTAKITPCYAAYTTAIATMMMPQADPAASALLDRTAKHLDRINKRLGIGKEIRSLGSVESQATGSNNMPSFALQRNHPGRLANGRPRHDNDFESISDIKIMPTSEEIQSAHAEYLPLQDASTWHKQGVDGLLDRHFRLLREDTVGQLRDSARLELETLQGAGPSANKSTLRKHTYTNVLVELPKFDPYRGLQFVISFDQPLELQFKSKKQRQEWWDNSKRLGGDAVVCLISSNRAVVFCSICFPEDPSRKQRRSYEDDEEEPVPDPHQNLQFSKIENRVRIIAQLVESTQENVAHVLGTFSNKDFIGGRSLVEFPGVLLPAFLPTLKALKATSDLPFAEFLAPLQERAEGTTTVPPPAYAQRAGFHFQLKPILQTGSCAFDPSNLKQSNIHDLQKASTLDETQASALLNSLSRSFALIQGPPGTGKSYTGVALVKTLVNNKKAGAQGPVLIVTFTNHALDQSLEHLLDQGITQIIRIGGNSKSERLTDFNLRKVAMSVAKTKVEKSEYGRTRGQMDQEARAITGYLSDLTREIQSIRECLSTNNPRHDAQLFGRGIDGEGWTEVKRGSLEDRLRKWLNGGRCLQSDRPVHTLVDVARLYDLSKGERHSLYNSWLQRAQEPILDALMDRINRFDELKSNLNNIQNELDLRVLNQADVIGVTTSGLARNLSLLQRLPSKVLLCEEAGEVLESHLLTALLPSIKHAILIGDHLQLRPRVQCYDLSQESFQGQQHALDTSLFERLVTATGGCVRLPLSRLDTQRRMHPDIAELVRSTLYPTLSDAPSTLEHPPVPGMKKRLFWLDHQHPESHGGMQSTSHTNDFEVEMTTALVSHLIKQGVHKPGAIAVLTPYLGQLRRLRLRMQSSFEVVLDDRDIKSLQDEGLDDAAQSRSPPAPGIQKGTIASAVRIATVDNFQGEEADVVIISLVRSNEQQKCGFLRTSNRINVLLSRAKNEMYIIGNSATTQNIPMWTEVLQLLQMNGNVGEALELACPRHTADDMKASMPDDFVRLAPDGGCILPCTQRLLCGHACPSSCHSQVLHDAVKCLAQCARKLGDHDCEHPCPKPCGEVCLQKCETIVRDVAVKLPCGHIKISLPCWQYYEQDSIKCDETVQRTVPGCGHTVSVRCSVDVNDNNFQCWEKCGDVLQCGYTCRRTCKDCKKRTDCIIVAQNHGHCRQPCGRDFANCSHHCTKPCHSDTDCGLCSKSCEVRCNHSVCDRKCSEPCPPCAEAKCSSSCIHSECSMPCGVPCDWVPCSLRCEKTLKCGHQCPSICGALCPEAQFCQECGDEEIQSRVVDLIMMSLYKDVDLDEDPCIFPACGHFYTLNTMDGHLGIQEHYVVDENGLPTALRAPNDSLDVDKTRIVCPDCRRSLRDIPRYGRIVRRALLIQSTLKFITWSNNDYVASYERFSKVQNTLQQSLEQAKPAEVDLVLVGSRDEQVQTIRKTLSPLRYGDLLRLRSDVQRVQRTRGQTRAAIQTCPRARPFCPPEQADRRGLYV